MEQTIAGCVLLRKLAAFVQRHCPGCEVGNGAHGPGSSYKGKAVFEFVQKRCSLGPSCSARIKDCHLAFMQFQVEQGEGPCVMRVQEFARLLRVCVPDIRTRGRHEHRWFEGVGLKPAGIDPGRHPSPPPYPWEAGYEGESQEKREEGGVGCRRILVCRLSKWPQSESAQTKKGVLPFKGYSLNEPICYMLKC